jgi:CheY-like chemotaxis protein
MEAKQKRAINILYAEDDLEDQMLVKDALNENRIANNFFFVDDGEMLMDFLNNRGEYEDVDKYPLPGLILLDLNMPKKDGREALQEIKSDPRLRHIPVIALTTSKAEEDIFHTYHLGLNSFIVKPVTFDSLVNIIKTLSQYWFEIVELPTDLEVSNYARYL